MSKRRTSCRLFVDGEFERGSAAGGGRYGEVHFARDLKNNRDVVIKLFKLEGENSGFPITAMREIRLLQMLSHINVVTLHEVVVSKDQNDKGVQDVFLVLEKADRDLQSFCGRRPNLLDKMDELQVRSYIYQLMSGLSFMHQHRVFHRDIKPANLLIMEDFHLKIADFGLSRAIPKASKRYTGLVCTLWYRAPELVLGVEHYDGAIDVWSAGVVLMEMLTGRVQFPCDSAPDLLRSICRLCGTPTVESWPAHVGLQHYSLFRHCLVDQHGAPYERSIRRVLKQRAPGIRDSAIDLVERMLDMNPRTRITAEEVLSHSFFFERLHDGSPDSWPATLCELRRLKQALTSGEGSVQRHRDSPAPVSQPPPSNPTFAASEVPSKASQPVQGSVTTNGDGSHASLAPAAASIDQSRCVTESTARRGSPTSGNGAASRAPGVPVPINGASTGSVQLPMPGSTAVAESNATAANVQLPLPGSTAVAESNATAANVQLPLPGVTAAAPIMPPTAPTRARAPDPRQRSGARTSSMFLNKRRQPRARSMPMQAAAKEPSDTHEVNVGAR